MASLFSKSNYVGFTATPYANVFIDPITTEDMLNHDLFPENFIYALPTPNNYIGPQQTFNKKGKYYNQLIFIKDAGRVEEDGWSFYFKHKKDWEDALPESLTDAIYTFYLANAIRDIRGHLSSHRSMLINISRFVRVQYYIKDKVSEIHDAAYRSVKFNLNPNDFENSMKDPIINRIYNNWVKHYSDVEFITWEDIAKVLLNAIKEIQIKVVNSTQKNDKLVYTDDSPIRVIAIGGLALSRGLTLEGLLTSYFFRNTATYDAMNDDPNLLLKIKFYILTDKNIGTKLLDADLLGNDPLKKSKRKSTKTNKKIKKSEFAGKPLEIDIWNTERFYELETLNSNEPISIDFKEDFNYEGIPCLKGNIGENLGYSAYIAIIPGKLLADIYIEYGSKVLEGIKSG